jgi:hypothetical protein
MREGQPAERVQLLPHKNFTGVVYTCVRLVCGGQIPAGSPAAAW